MNTSGITPAYAGKSMCHSFLTAGHWDHPRVCGEKLPSLSMVPTPIGSPPRMRGKAAVIVFENLVEGITPAYAGKSALG